MNAELLRLVDSIARERSVDRDLLLGDIEQAMVSAARKHFNSLDAEEFGCQIDRLNGEMTIWRNKFDLEGNVTREAIPIESLGRIPAQTAKQVMIQRFREDERSSVLDEFSRRQGEIVTGVAQRYEGGALVVQVEGRVDGFMPRSEQIPGEQFQPNDRVRCMILDVRDAGSQVKIVLSRSHPEFIRRLFEAEVPEVSERTIEIKAMAREPGFRTKLAVASVDSKVDPVGACVGIRGSRIRNIVDELAGEKIDIVRWNESSQILLANALKPAEVEEVSLCFELGRATIIVRDDQLSLAIGKRGQNVRLAARLTGWDVDILTPGEFQKGLDTLSETVLAIEGVDQALLDRMGALGMISVFDVEEVGSSVLCDELEVDEQVAQRMVEICTERAKVVAEQQQREKEDQARLKAEQEAVGAALLDSDGAAPDETAESRAADILGGFSEPTDSAEQKESVNASDDPEPADSESKKESDALGEEKECADASKAPESEPSDEPDTATEQAEQEEATAN